jgi:hypothetical protein
LIGAQPGVDFAVEKWAVARAEGAVSRRLEPALLAGPSRFAEVRQQVQLFKTRAIWETL